MRKEHLAPHRQDADFKKTAWITAGENGAQNEVALLPPLFVPPFPLMFAGSDGIFRLAFPSLPSLTPAERKLSVLWRSPPHFYLLRMEALKSGF